MLPTQPPTQVGVRVNFGDIWPNWRNILDFYVKGVLWKTQYKHKQEGMFPGHDGHVPGRILEHA